LHQHHLQYTGGLAETQGLLLPSLYLTLSTLLTKEKFRHRHFSVLIRTF
jgi:hypothetical protein